MSSIPSPTIEFQGFLLKVKDNGDGTVTLLTSPSNPPTLTQKMGSGLGDYTHSGDTNLVDVDPINLSYTVTVPVGWKLKIQAMGSCYVSTNVAFLELAISDGGTPLAVQVVVPGVVGSPMAFGVQYLLNGDGNSHTIRLQYKTFTAGDAISIFNQTLAAPTMLFELTQSN